MCKPCPYVLTQRHVHAHTQPLLQMVLPKPGEGPSRDLMMKGFWNVNIYAEASDDAGNKQIVQGKVAGKHDPGYYDTSRMLLECGLALALQVETATLLQACDYCL